MLGWESDEHENEHILLKNKYMRMTEGQKKGGNFQVKQNLTLKFIVNSSYCINDQYELMSSKANDLCPAWGYVDLDLGARMFWIIKHLPCTRTMTTRGQSSQICL